MAVIVNRGNVFMNRFPSVFACRFVVISKFFLRLSPLSSKLAIKLTIFIFCYMLLDCGFPLKKKILWHCPFKCEELLYNDEYIYIHEIIYTWSIPEVLWILWSGPASGSGSRPETTHPPPKVHTIITILWAAAQYCILYHCIMFYIFNIQLTVICSWQQGRKIYYRDYSILSHFC